MYLIDYICGIDNENGIRRKLYFSDEFLDFYNQQQERVKVKFDYVIGIVRTEDVVTTRFVKHLVDTGLYETRVSVGSNEYRTVLFAIDNENVILARRILVLNAFLRKSEKDYRKQVEKAKKNIGRIHL